MSTSALHYTLKGSALNFQAQPAASLASWAFQATRELVALRLIAGCTAIKLHLPQGAALSAVAAHA